MKQLQIKASYQFVLFQLNIMQKILSSLIMQENINIGIGVKAKHLYLQIIIILPSYKNPKALGLKKDTRTKKIAVYKVIYFKNYI